MTSDLYHMFIYVLCVGEKRKGGTRIQKHLIRDLAISLPYTYD